MTSAERRASAAILVCGVAAGALLLWTMQAYRPQVEFWVREDPAPRARIVIVGLMIVLSAPVVGMAVYFWRRVSQMVGDDVAGRGAEVRLLAAALALAGALLTALLWRLVLLLPAR